MSNVVRPIELFYSYSHKDKVLRQKLEEHLRVLQREDVIAAWHYEQITAGSDWSLEIRQHLERADVVLLLVSSAFHDSDYCNNIELRRAMARHKEGKARVIPVILRNCAWKKTILRDLKALPSNGDAVTQWRDRDAAFTDVVEGISKVAEELRQIGEKSRSEVPNTEVLRAEIGIGATVPETYRKYKDAGHAFSAARKRIEEEFKEPRRGRREFSAELRLLAIAMTQSWHFVSHDLPDILKNCPKAMIRIQILLCDPDFLDSLKLDTDFEHWAERCRQNIDGLKALTQRPICTEGRLVIHLKTYKQIPQWHGLLVGRNICLWDGQSGHLKRRGRR